MMGRGIGWCGGCEVCRRTKLTITSPCHNHEQYICDLQDVPYLDPIGSCRAHCQCKSVDRYVFCNGDSIKVCHRLLCQSSEAGNGV